MNDLTLFGKVLILFGIFITFLGALFLAGPYVPFFGRLPGDMLFKRDNITFYIPITTSLISSLTVTLLINWLLRGHK